MKTKCMSCGGSMKKMQKGGMVKSIIKPFVKKVVKKVVKKITKPTTPKMAVGGTTTKRIIKKSTGGMYGIPQENLGTSGQYGFAKKGGTHKMQNGGTTKADPYGVSSEKKRYDKSRGNMGPTKIVRKKVDPKAPKASKTRTIERDGTFEMKTGGSTKATKFAALAPPYNKATFADKIVGAKKSAKKK